MTIRSNLAPILLNITGLLAFTICPLNAQIIPAADRVDWSAAGLHASPPVHADTVFNVPDMPGATWDAKIAAAKDAAKNWVAQHPINWAIIYFPAGTYTFGNTIFLDQSCRNMVFQGAGSGSTVLQFSFGGTNQNCFKFYGYDEEASKRYLAADLDKGISSIQCSTPIGYSAPCWIRLCEEDHPYNEGDPWAAKSVGQITRMESASGNSGVIKDVASKQYTVSRHTCIWPVMPVMNIGIENLTIKRLDSGSASSGDYGLNIWFKYAVNCWIKGVHFDQTCKHHLKIQLSAHIYTSGCYFHDARSFDGDNGGCGYGVMLTESTSNCLIENNVFHKLRHAMLVQAGANCNVLSYNYSYEQCWTSGGIYYPGDTQYFGFGPGGDICFHGNYPYANLIEHNFCERIVADSHHGDNWKMNTIVRNRVTNDHDSDRSWIYIRRAPNTNLLGNMRSSQFASEVEYAYCDMYWDYFGFEYGTYGYNHNYYFLGWGDEDISTLADVSYYYSSRPAFLPANFTWPTIGPKVSLGSGSLSQGIPARERFWQELKTYNINPILHPYTLSGTITQNLTLLGYICITSDVTIASGYTLTLQPGSIVSISSSARITVNGTLKAEGTAAQKIIFTRTGASGSWYGIRFEDSSIDADCKLKYCDITYSSYGVYCSHASPKIENNTFSNNTYAFYLYYSSPSIKTNLISNDRIFADHSNPYFFDNHINNPYENYAMYLFQSSPSLLRNTFEGTMIDYMIKAHSYSNPGFGHISDSVQAYNRIEASGGDWAFLAEDHSLPFLGSTNTCVYRGKLNTIMGADVICLAAAHTYSRIEAGYVWWGQYPAPTGQFYADGTSYLGYSFALNSDPGGGSSLGKSISQLEEDSDNDSVFNPPAPVGCDSLWQIAEKAVADCKIPAALAVYETLMSRYSQTAQAHFALARTIDLQKETSAGALGATLARLLATPKLDRPFLAATKDAIMNNFLRLGDPKAASIAAEEIVAEYPGSMQEYSALYTLYSIYSMEMHDEGQARQILETLKEKHPNRELTLIAQYDMGEKVEWKLAKEPASKESVVQTAPAVVKLGANYPNPFNSTTVIPFYVPSESIVTLTIYDILGRQIAVLIDGRVASGQQRVMWNGCDRAGVPVAAGLYFCRLQAGTFSQTRKLLMIK